MEKTILICEDDLQLIEMYRKKFEIEGFHVLTAEDGEEALEKLKNITPDMVLLDIMMPKVDGIEVLRSIRQNPQTADLKVIVLTNLGAEATAEEIYKLGASDYIVKSEMTPLEVANKVKEILT